MSKQRNKPLKDPYAGREARKYVRPIPSRECILEHLSGFKKPQGWLEICDSLGLDQAEDGQALTRRLAAMERDGQLLRNRRDRYCVVNQRDLVAGTVIGHPDGFGFLKRDSGGDDLFLSPREMRSLLHGDRVVVSLGMTDHRGRTEAQVVNVLERRTKTVVGRMYLEHGVSRVVSDNKRVHLHVLIPPDSRAGAKNGQIVLAEIVEQPSARSQPIGRVVEVIGDHLAPGMEIEVAIRSYDLPYVWPQAVLDEADEYSVEIPESGIEGRVDLRKTPLVTIDGADARDFDDAVYAQKTSKGWKLLVAIADVSHYVAPASALDQEAEERGNSVYFPERVIPMLPEVLSNGLCSLNPNVDRLCMVCEMLIDGDGQLSRSRFYKAVMHSHARLTYDEVYGILQGTDPEATARRSSLIPQLNALHDLYKTLRHAREERGAIDFDTLETRIVFGPHRKIESIEPVHRNDAHRLIEECMLMANTATALFLARKKMPFLRRIHAAPTVEKVTDVRAFLGELGLHLGGGDEPQPKDYMHLLAQVEDRPDAHLIQTVLLRSLSQAVYSTEEQGHFGLALEAYAHFTSPIRRYPDLLVHRAIKHALKKGTPETFHYSASDMALLGESCSHTERRADEATRDVISWLKCEYMEDKIGESFKGVIASVTSFGLFVELVGVFVEGLVHITALGDDYYVYDAGKHRLVGERTGQTFRLGDAIQVKVVRVDLDEKKIDFELVSSKRSSKKTKTSLKASNKNNPGKRRRRR